MKLLINISVSLCAIFIALLMAEGAVRLFTSYWFQQTFRETLPKAVIFFGNCHLADFRTSQPSSFFRITNSPPDLLYENRPSASGVIYDKMVKVNSAGLRDTEVSLNKPVGTYRVAVLGDSVVFGYGAEQKSVLSEVLENKLNERGIRTEVMNFGVPGYSTKQEIVQLEHKVLNYKPDLVIIAQHPNDIYGTGVTSLTPSRILKFMAEHSKLLGCFNRDGQLISGKSVLGGNKPSGTFPEVYAENSETWGSYGVLFDAIGNISRKEQIPIIIATLPEFKDLNEKYEYGYIHEKVGARAEQAGLKVIKMHPPVISYEENFLNYRAFPDDMDHPNAKGHAKLAEIIYNNLIDNGLLPTNGPEQ